MTSDAVEAHDPHLRVRALAGQRASRAPEGCADSGFGQAEQWTLNSQLFPNCSQVSPPPEWEKVKKINWLGEEDSNLH